MSGPHITASFILFVCVANLILGYVVAVALGWGPVAQPRTARRSLRELLAAAVSKTRVLATRDFWCNLWEKIVARIRVRQRTTDAPAPADATSAESNESSTAIAENTTEPSDEAAAPATTQDEPRDAFDIALAVLSSVELPTETELPPSDEGSRAKTNANSSAEPAILDPETAVKLALQKAARITEPISVPKNVAPTEAFLESTRVASAVPGNDDRMVAVIMQSLCETQVEELVVPENVIDPALPADEQSSTEHSAAADATASAHHDPLSVAGDSNDAAQEATSPTDILSAFRNSFAETAQDEIEFLDSPTSPDAATAESQNDNQEMLAAIEQAIKLADLDSATADDITFVEPEEARSDAPPTATAPEFEAIAPLDDAVEFSIAPEDTTDAMLTAIQNALQANNTDAEIELTFELPSETDFSSAALPEEELGDAVVSAVTEVAETLEAVNAPTSPAPASDSPPSLPSAEDEALAAAVRQALLATK